MIENTLVTARNAPTVKARTVAASRAVRGRQARQPSFERVHAGPVDRRADAGREGRGGRHGLHVAGDGLGQDLNRGVHPGVELLACGRRIRRRVRARRQEHVPDGPDNSRSGRPRRPHESRDKACDATSAAALASGDSTGSVVTAATTPWVTAGLTGRRPWRPRGSRPVASSGWRPRPATASRRPCPRWPRSRGP